MNASTTIQGKTAVIHLRGKFDFRAYATFRDELKDVLTNDSVSDIQIDLGGVEYIDSSALRMLLISQANAKATDRTLALSNVRGLVKQVLDVANFQRLFTIIG